MVSVASRLAEAQAELSTIGLRMAAGIGLGLAVKEA